MYVFEQKKKEKKKHSDDDHSQKIIGTWKNAKL